MAKKSEENKNTSMVKAVLALALVGGTIWFYFGGGIDKYAHKELKRIGGNVALDAVKQYNIVKRGGNAIDVCGAAGFVAAAYLQIQDSYNYHKWKKVEEKDCKRAGLRF